MVKRYKSLFEVRLLKLLRFSKLETYLHIFSFSVAHLFIFVTFYCHKYCAVSNIFISTVASFIRVLSVLKG